MARKSEKELLLDGFWNFYYDIIVSYEELTYDKALKKHNENLSFLTRYFPLPNNKKWQDVFELGMDCRIRLGYGYENFSQMGNICSNMMAHVSGSIIPVRILDTQTPASKYFLDEIKKNIIKYSKFFIDDNEYEILVKKTDLIFNRLKNVKSKSLDIKSAIKKLDIPDEIIEFVIHAPILIEISELAGYRFRTDEIRDEYINNLKNNTSNSIIRAKNEIGGVF